MKQVERLEFHLSSFQARPSATVPPPPCVSALCVHREEDWGREGLVLQGARSGRDWPGNRQWQQFSECFFQWVKGRALGKDNKALLKVPTINSSAVLLIRIQAVHPCPHRVGTMSAELLIWLGHGKKWKVDQSKPKISILCPIQKFMILRFFNFQKNSS